MKTGQIFSRLCLSQRVLWLSLFLALAILVAGGGQIAYARYADGSGAGKYQNQIYWLEWDGFTFANGQSKTFSLPGNVTIVATVSNISGGAVRIGRPEDYGPAAFNRAYPNTGQTAINSCVACINRFRLTLSANVAGTTVPVDMVVADAEAAAGDEYFKVTTDGNPWQMLEQFQAANLSAAWSHNDQTLVLHGNGSTNYGTVLAVSTGVTNFDFELKGGGVSAAALGVFLPSDYGDAPASFSDACHYIRQVFTGGLPGATKIYDPVSTKFTSFATISDAPTVFLGSIKPDADPGSLNTGADAATALGDDLDNTDDEDGVASFPLLPSVPANYAITVAVTNNSQATGTLYGWIDFNGNGSFEPAEAAMAAVAAGGSVHSVALTWTNVSASAQAVGSTYARIRFTTSALTDNGATAVDDRSLGGVADGEVEDYRIQTHDFGDAPKDMSTIDAALTNAYPTLLADNGARHALDATKRLGALIDGDLDGQPNLAADGDDTHNLNDADGVAFNPALGITTARVILSGVSNTLVVTASAGGFLNTWIDYNQNGTFTDAGEQIFADRAVTAGANALTFVTPNTAPHGATYMRFRYSTLAGVANTPVGLAPDGEVEDYRVEVALPTPTTCAAGLVNGSFEAPVLASNSNIFPSDQVPGWAFRATNPSSGANFFERHAIEIWTNGFLGVPAYQGRQFAEINGYVNGNLYQDVVTVPGSTLAWTVAHRGRDGTDVMAIKIGAPGATGEVRRATDDNTQWRVRNGTYDVPPGQTITRFEFEAISSSGGNASSGNLVDAISFSLPCDYGDAPDTYGTSSGANGANHLRNDGLYLGSIYDTEGTGFPGANADGDDLNTYPDEDGLTKPLPPLDVFATSYSLTAIPLLNNTGSPAHLYGWVDFNRNGSFEASEGVSTTVPANAAPQTATLTWTGRSGTVAGQSYVRLRLSPQAGLTPVGVGGAGEVEDYPLTITSGGTILVTKNTVGGNGSFAFTSTIPAASNFSLVTAGGTASRTFAGVAPGVYAISETVPAGWVLTGATCSNGAPDSFTLAGGATVTCTFTDTQLSQLFVLKRTVGGDGVFPFTSTLPLGSSFNLTTTAGRTGKLFTGLLPGSYAVNETAAAGWDLTAATCSNGDAPGALGLGAGVSVSCTFTNTKRGSLTVVKETVGGNGVFTFTGSLNPASFQLTTTNGTAQRPFTGLTPGTYSVTETVPAGWTLKGVTCSDGSDPASIGIAPGEDVTCTFRNEKLDTIVVVALALGGDATFGYTSTVPGGSSFALTTTASSAYTYFFDVAAATYAISQTTTPAGWELAGAICSDGSDPASITLTAGETIVCTFVNAKDDTIIVEKRTIGGDGVFPFTSTVPGSGNFGITTTNGVGRTSITVTSPISTYSIVETVPQGWDLTGATCDNGDSPNSITVGVGETVTCIFTDTRRSDLTVLKLADGGDGTFAFTSTIPAAAAFALTTTGSVAAQTFADTLPGTYVLTETAQTGWDLTSALCDNGDTPDNLTLDPGADVNCLFFNTKRASLTVVKQATGGDGTFAFTSTIPAAAAFALTTTSGAAQQTFTNLFPGAYAVTEAALAGWDLDGAACDNGDAPDSITLLAGDTVTCTFANTRLAHLTVVKETAGGDGAFAFSSTTLTPATFTLTTTGGTAQRTFSDLRPGGYDVSESVPVGWDWTGAACTNGDTPDSVTLAAGDVVTCTLQNTRRGNVVVVKNTVGGDGIFQFSSQTLNPALFNLTTLSGTAQQSFTDLVPGVYDVTETVSAGWDLVSACSNGANPASITVAPGLTVTCSFTNTRRGSLTVVKHAVGGDGGFAFTSPTLGAFNLATTGGAAQTTFTDLLPGTYSVTETVPAGWDLTGVTCSNRSNVDNIGIAPGENVTCSFTNTRRGSLTIVKNTVGGDGSFAYTSPQLGAFSLTTANTTARRTFDNLLPGGYSVNEVAPAGWDQTVATCSDGGSPANVVVDPGENVTCIFVNTRRATLTVVKNTVGGDGSFDFASQTLGNFTVATVGGNGQRVFNNLAPGAYAVAENVPAGWDLNAATCSDGSDPASINLAPGENVTCTFVDTRRGSLTVVKNTTGGDGQFGFTSNAVAGGVFSVVTAGGTGQITTPPLLPGTYFVTETVPAGWRLDSATCSDGSAVDNIAIAPGEDVVCTFDNLKLDTIIVVKRALGGDATFDFASQALGDFSLATVNGLAQRNFPNLAPGTYDLSESVPVSWTLSSAVCSDGSNPASISLTAGETVLCTFINLKQDTIVVEKKTIGGDDSFAFSSPQLGGFVLTTTAGAASQSFVGLQPGAYSISETLPVGWVQTAATCSDGSNPANINLAPGLTVRCTFTNTRLSSITVIKRAVGGDATFAFTGSLGAFDLKTASGIAKRSFYDLAAGTYAVNESVPAGWDLTGATCNDGSSPANIDLAPGENVTCTFQNTQRGSLTVVKNTVGADGVFTYTSQALNGFTLATAGGTAQRSFADLAPGVYDLAETAQDGWALTRATCSDGSSPASVAVDPGEDVTCTFENTKLDTIILIKRAVGGDATFNFTSTTLVSPTVFSLTTVNGAAQRSFSNLAPGVYDIRENVPVSWTLSSATCSDGSDPASIDLRAGETVVCVFINLKQDTIIVEKESLGRDREFTFSSPQLGSFVLTTTNNYASQTFSGLPAGAYAITESVPAGWDLTRATCDNGDAPASISLAPGETVKCTFQDTQRGSLTVTKGVLGADAVFAFTSNTLPPASFSITTTGGQGATTIPNLVPGVYDVSEVGQPGWDLFLALCDAWETPDRVTVGPGEDITCGFLNIQRGSLTIVKQTQGGDGSFTFASQTLGDFVLTTTGGTTTTGGAAQQRFLDLAPGDYDLREVVPAGWRQTAASCDNGSDPANITVNPGEDVTCTFKNTKLASLTIAKQAAGGDATFGFAGSLGVFSVTTTGGSGRQSFANLTPGAYSVAENALAGWDLTATTCSDGSDPASLNLAPGENVTCLFHNVKRSAIIVTKQTTGGDGLFSFAGGTLGNFSLVTNAGGAQRTFADILPGAYSITETATNGWDLTAVVCSDGSSPASISLDAGETVTCTFANTKRGSLTVVKQASGGDATFPFSSQALGNFNLATAGGTAQQTFANLQPGAYDLSEATPAGWDLISATCSDGSNPATIDLAAGENVTCTFTNVKRGSLTVVKQTTGGDGAFPFVSQALGNFDLVTVNGRAQRTFGNLVPRAYDLSETAPAGWRLEGATCSDGSNPASVAVDPGENVTCTVTNLKLDTIIVVKRAVGGDAAFPFASQPLGNFVLTTTNGAAQQSFTGLAPGAYAIAESAPAGWTPTVADPVCSNGDPASAINLDAGETVVCVFINLKQDTIVVEKQAVGGDGAFAFTSPQLGGFVLTTTNGAANQNFSGLSPTNYSISETVPAGWVLSGATCDNGAAPVNLSLAPGVNVRCTFTNTRLSSITVVKATTGGDGAFAYGGSLGDFTLTTLGGLAQRRFTGMAAGTYAVTETASAGWDLTRATCSDGSNPASIGLAPGEHVTCTFANTKRGSLTVVKRADGGDGGFPFTSQALGSFVLTTTNGSAQKSFANLTPGSYDLLETAPAGWNLGAVTCSDGSNPASVAVDAGEDVTCTFENLKTDTLMILNLAIGGNGTFPFASQALGNFVLTTTNGVATAIFSGLAPGAYDMRAGVVADWNQYALTCTNGNDPASITLTQGATVLCTFVNLLQNTIVVEKRTSGGDGTFGFTSQTLTPNAFSLTTSGNVTTTSFPGLRPGVYDVAESAVAGWDLTGATCSDGSSPASIELLADESVTCTFTNTQRSRVTVIKHVVGGDGAFAFGGSLGDFSLTTGGGAAQQSFDNLTPGSYVITEVVPAGWSLASAVCDNGDAPAALTLAPGADVVCSFTNARTPGVLVIRVTAQPGDGTFSFTSPQLGAFSLATVGGAAAQSFTSLPPGLYSVVALAAAGWDLTSATCDNGDNPASVTVGAGATVTCTFANRKQGSITIVKVAENGNGAFQFVSQALGNFTLTTAGSLFRGSAQRVFPDLTAGTYDIAELPAPQWVFVSASCNDGSNPAAIGLEAGEVVTCTFVSRPQPTALPEGEEPEMDRQMFLPLINR